MAIVAVDLFCGVGGLTRGLMDAGIEVRAGIDIDPDAEYPYKENNGAEFVRADISDVSRDDIRAFYNADDVTVLAGCAPCQPFSAYGQTRKREHQDWKLLYEFGRLVERIQPLIVTMENVPQLKNHRVFDDFVNVLRKSKYSVSYSVVQGPDYGIPQYRKRLVLFASKMGPIGIVDPTHGPDEYVTVRDTIAHLEPLRAGEVSRHDALHRTSTLSEINLQRIRVSRPGGTWHEWPEEIVATCHVNTKGKGYVSVYGRMEWDKPAPTITTQAYGFGNGRFGHPEQDRAISLREAALLQTFPETYRFCDPNKRITMKRLGRLIGNAVPVRLGQIVGNTIIRHVRDTCG